MKSYGRQRSAIKPDSLVVDEFSVWQYDNISDVLENIGELNEFSGFEFDLVQFDKDEFIKLQAQKSIDLEAQLTDTQLALCNIYENKEM